jgi:3-hydroxyisobutyrate dehydrogenase
MFPRWILTDSFDSGFSAGLMRKDVRLALELAADSGVQLPLSAHVAEIWRASCERIPDTTDFTRMADYRNKEAL